MKIASATAPSAARFVRERLLGGMGALIGLLGTGLLAHYLYGPIVQMPLIVAPFGASAVLLFAVPASPLAQPWAVLGGNILSAIVGVTVANLGLDQLVAASIAIGASISAMALLRCLHPPGGAVALTAVLGGPAILSGGYLFALAPVGLGTLLLVAMAWLFHRVSGHSYPHVAAHVARPPEPLPGDFTREDLRRALEAYPDVLDVDFADLEEVLLAAEHEAARRRGAGS